MRDRKRSTNLTVSIDGETFDEYDFDLVYRVHPGQEPSPADPGSDHRVELVGVVPSARSDKLLATAPNLLGYLAEDECLTAALLREASEEDASERDAVRAARADELRTYHDRRLDEARWE